MEKEDARVLLSSTQQLRTHWSGILTTYMGYAITLNVAVWAYFLKAYVDSLHDTTSVQPLYIGVAAAVSSVTLSLWRLYVRYIDNHIAGLYADFLSYEHILSTPPDKGTSGYLSREVPRLVTVLQNENLNAGDKVQAISTLVKSRRIGRRGHLLFDLCVLLLIVGMLCGSILAFRHGEQLGELFPNICLGFIFLGLLITVSEFLYFQRDPDQNTIEKILMTVKPAAVKDAQLTTVNEQAKVPESPATAKKQEQVSNYQVIFKTAVRLVSKLVTKENVYKGSFGLFALMAFVFVALLIAIALLNPTDDKLSAALKGNFICQGLVGLVAWLIAYWERRRRRWLSLLTLIALSAYLLGMFLQLLNYIT